MSDKPYIDFTNAGNQYQLYTQSIYPFALLSLAMSNKPYIDLTMAGNQ